RPRVLPQVGEEIAGPPVRPSRVGPRRFEVALIEREGIFLQLALYPRQVRRFGQVFEGRWPYHAIDRVPGQQVTARGGRGMLLGRFARLLLLESRLACREVGLPGVVVPLLGELPRLLCLVPVPRRARLGRQGLVALGAQGDVGAPADDQEQERG